MIEVVVVERDRALGRLYQEELSEAGFGVRVRRGVREACACLRRQPAHILVTDLNSVDGNLAGGLADLREVHRGPLFLLGPAKARRDLSVPDLPLIDKSSDLSALICHLRGRSIDAMWSKAAAAHS
jgi:hypothetical protein